MSSNEEYQAPTICGANCRSGGVCSKPPAPGKSRCHAHGGAPKTGAPVGNLNALKHGAFVGGRARLDSLQRQRARNMSRSERGRIPRLDRDAKAFWKDGARPPNPVQEILGRDWDGEDLRLRFLKAKAIIEEEIMAAGHLGHVPFDESWAVRDVLECLCREPDWFLSLQAFVDGVRRVFLYLDHGAWEVPRPGTDEATQYYLAWRSFCASLYDQFCPDCGDDLRRNHEERRAQEASLLKFAQTMLKLQGIKRAV